MLNNTKLHPICSECKGKNVELREFRETVWDPINAKWNEEGEYEAYEYCISCGADWRMVWVSLEEYNAAPIKEEVTA